MKGISSGIIKKPSFSVGIIWIFKYKYRFLPMKKLNKKCNENWYNIFLFNLLFYLTIFGWLWEKNSFWDVIVFLAVQFGKMIQIKELRFCHKLKLPNLYISISLQSDYVNLGYFKLRLFGPTEFIVWNIKGRKKNWLAKI